MLTEKTHLSWEISPMALLMLATMYFFDKDGFFAALLPAVFVHEAGHAVFLKIGGLQPRRIRLGLFGFEMDYWGQLKGLPGFSAIAAGPLMGLAYGFICQQLKTEYWIFSGSISILLSLFNLLPVLPLDGGRILCMAAGKWGNKISRGIGAIIAIVALYLWLSRGWFSIFAIGLWLVWCNWCKQ